MQTEIERKHFSDDAIVKLLTSIVSIAQVSLRKHLEVGHYLFERASWSSASLDTLLDLFDPTDRGRLAAHWTSDKRSNYKRAYEGSLVLNRHNIPRSTVEQMSLSRLSWFAANEHHILPRHWQALAGEATALGDNDWKAARFRSNRQPLKTKSGESLSETARNYKRAVQESSKATKDASDVQSDMNSHIRAVAGHVAGLPDKDRMSILRSCASSVSALDAETFRVLVKHFNLEQVEALEMALLERREVLESASVVAEPVEEPAAV